MATANGAQAAYKACLDAICCTEEQWQGIRSGGRQGVLRAFQQGGVRKAQTKMQKMLAARARESDETVKSQVSDQISTRRLKKRRRRANARERSTLNAVGALTQGQLYELYALQKGFWEQVRRWLLPLRISRHPRRKELLEAGWQDEYTQFQREYGIYCDKDVGFVGPNRALFISVVTQAIMYQPNEATAAKLWAILDSHGLGGERLGQCTSVQVPLGRENVGARMLEAMGWVQGDGLGKQGQGIKEPLSVDEANAKRRAGVGWIDRNKLMKVKNNDDCRA